MRKDGSNYDCVSWYLTKGVSKYVTVAPNERHIDIIKYSHINYICVVCCSRAIYMLMLKLCFILYLYYFFYIPLTTKDATEFIE